MTLLTNKEPTYEHDCKTCTFLGSEVQEGEIVDLYVHVNQFYLSMVTRRSSEPPDYACYTVERKDRTIRAKLNQP